MGSALFTTYDGESVVELKNTSIFRQLPPQCDGWTGLRIGLRMQLRMLHGATNQSTLYGTRFFVGLSSGGLYGFCDRSETVHCVGTVLPHPSTSYDAYALNTGFGVPYFYSCSIGAAKKVGATITHPATGAYYGDWRTIPSDAGIYMATLLLEMVKSPPNFQFSSQARLQGSAARTIENTRFQTGTLAFENVSRSADFYDSGNWSTFDASAVLPVNEAVDGTLDHLHISWGPHEHSSMLISDVFVRKFA